MRRARETHERIKAEIAREKVAALGRAGERLEAALEIVAAIGRRIDASVSADERQRLLGDYEVARVRALHARLALVIQREAVGLRVHRVVDQRFPEPPRRTCASTPAAS
ncbi:MAG: hypothetical protein HYU25_02355 [Candidatus Rokubacteria bacterium]|nr:hypothetical protein [Candidatus Rokubacteria bacterium]